MRRRKNIRFIQLQKIALFLFGLLALLPLAGQEQARWIVGLQGGSAVYQGDISRDGFGTLRGQTFVFGGGLQYRPHPFWSIGLQAHRGSLLADDEFYTTDDFRMARQFRFTTDFTDLAVLGRFYPFGKIRFQPQVGLGFGMVFYEPTPALLDNTILELTDFIKADLETNIEDRAWFIPVRFGMAYQFSERFSMEVGLQYNFTQTDFLDGVSLAGNPQDNDRYGHVYVGTAIHLGFASDIDQDGIADFEDSCPLKPGTARTQGCPDADQDGIRDSADRCPYAAGAAIMEGCPDTDGDGITDPYDRCPALAGPAEALGCPPRDNDGDGVLDHQDDCPLEPGPADRSGCPAVDSDLDGLLDEDDRCPNHFGIPLFDGCPDTDGDGIEDYKDGCPNTLGDYVDGGCPQVATPQAEADLLSKQLLHFRINSADLFNYPLLDRLVQFLHRNPSYRLSIHGHADLADREEAPGYLSQLRAERVKRYLMDSGVNDRQLLVRGFSNRVPLYTDESPARRFLNRRVEFSLERGD
ncbi:MAG: thrombospondin type 3 repeat-containing protein [Bacteroidota bacterium]